MFKAPSITKILVQEEKLPVTRAGVHDFLKRYEAYGCLLRRPGSGRPNKIIAEVKRIVEAQMQLDDETIAQQLHALLTSKGYALSVNTILCCRSSLGWTFRGSAYCQLIREENKLKRFEWALANKLDDFKNVIFQMNVLYKWRHTADIVVENKVKLPDLSPGLNIPIKYMCGQESV